MWTKHKQVKLHLQNHQIKEFDVVKEVGSPHFVLLEHTHYFAGQPQKKKLNFLRKLHIRFDPVAGQFDISAGTATWADTHTKCKCGCAFNLQYCPYYFICFVWLFVWSECKLKRVPDFIWFQKKPPVDLAPTNAANLRGTYIVKGGANVLTNPPHLPHYAECLVQWRVISTATTQRHDPHWATASAWIAGEFGFTRGEFALQISL